MPDATLKGAVTQISPAGTQSSGVVNYPVTVTLDKADDAVKTGMTANLTIVTSQAENVLTVPNQSDQDGQQAEGGHAGKGRPAGADAGAERGASGQQHDRDHERG